MKEEGAVMGIPHMLHNLLFCQAGTPSRNINVTIITIKLRVWHIWILTVHLKADLRNYGKSGSQQGRRLGFRELLNEHIVSSFFFFFLTTETLDV